MSDCASGRLRGLVCIAPVRSGESVSPGSSSVCCLGQWGWSSSGVGDFTLVGESRGRAAAGGPALAGGLD